MKITVELDENCIEEEVVIRCKELNDSVNQIQRAITEITRQESTITLYRDKTEYYIPIKDILFFESDGDIICAHTKETTFITKYKLYELEKMLPWYFTRISKSAILNVKKVYAITKNITASSAVEFQGTTKMVYVSRGFYKSLMSKMEDLRK
ncbi:MAG: LytTR family transcriptional regulator [Eubacterium sp.]|nr:LytTR family transcriptional regulator [Eubacterium sp.]